jgi:hypothetical protein
MFTEFKELVKTMFCIKGTNSKKIEIVQFERHLN